MHEIAVKILNDRVEAGLAARLPGSMIAAVLGAFLFFGAGLASMSVAHNVAHDARHIHAFPCH